MHTQKKKNESIQQKSSQEEQQTAELKVHPCFLPAVPEFVVICPVWIRCMLFVQFPVWSCPRKSCLSELRAELK